MNSHRAAPIRRLLAGRSRRSLVLLLSIVMTIGALGVAIAETNQGTSNKIIEFGPEDPTTGYPTWYRDSGFEHAGTYYDSVDLEPCLGDKDPMCLPAPAPDPTKPMDPKTGNFPDEFFYYTYNAAGLVSSGGNPVLFESALEGTWAAEEVKDGDQAVFGRVRIRVEDLQAGGEYTVTHPQGVDKFVATADKRGISYTQDIAAVPKGFDAAFKSRVGPFLRYAPNADDPNDRPPAGYIGDPAEDHKVIGSPFGTNYVKIEGPAVGGLNNPNPCPGLTATTSPDCIYTELFNLMGKLSKTGGVETNRVTYSRGADGKTVFDVFARSKGSQSMLVRDGAGTGTTRFATTPLVGRQGKYFAHVGVADAALPETVTVVNTSDDPDTVQEVELKDLVTVTSAVYDTTAKTLTVKAESSDKLMQSDAPVATLSLPDYPGVTFTDGTATIADLPLAPPTVKVASSQGDVGVGSVVATGPASPALSAVASGPTTAEQGSKVTLSALNSLGQITAYEWTAPAGVTLQGADTATPSFTVPKVAAGTELVFTLKVTGPSGSETATVTVKVLPITAPKAAITPIGTVEQGTQVTLDGSRSTGAATFLWKQVQADGDPPATLDVVDEPTLKFTFPQDVPVDPVTGEPKPLTFELTVKNVDGVESVATIDLNSATADALTTTRVRFVPDKARWVIDGTAKLLQDNEVTVHAGPTLDGKVIGTATVINTGAGRDARHLDRGRRGLQRDAGRRRVHRPGGQGLLRQHRVQAQRVAARGRRR